MTYELNKNGLQKKVSTSETKFQNSSVIAELIIKKVLRVFEMEYDVFVAKTRKREIVMARQVAHFLLKNKTKLSLSRIGLIAGAKDHATVMHSIKTVQNAIDINDRSIVPFVNECELFDTRIKVEPWIEKHPQSKIDKNENDIG